MIEIPEIHIFVQFADSLTTFYASCGIIAVFAVNLFILDARLLLSAP